jgi:hypothetical protein
MRLIKVLIGVFAAIALGAGGFLLMTANASETTLRASADAQTAPARAMQRREPVAPPEHTRTYVSQSPATTLQTGADGMTPVPDYDCTHANGQVQECWCDEPLDCKDMVLNGPCGDDDIWWTSGESTLGCSIQASNN